MPLDQVDQRLLSKVWVVLDLEGGGQNTSVAEKVEDQSSVVVADTNALGKALVNELLHGLPCVGKSSLAGGDVLATLVLPAGRVADGGVDVLQGNWEVDNEEVKVVDAPVLELLVADRLDALLVVEGVPELGDDEKLLTLDKTVLDGAGNTLTALLLIAVI